MFYLPSAEAIIVIILHYYAIMVIERAYKLDTIMGRRRLYLHVVRHSSDGR
jgi:hypothetical protein